MNEIVEGIMWHGKGMFSIPIRESYYAKQPPDGTDDKSDHDLTEEDLLEISNQGC